MSGQPEARIEPPLVEHIERRFRSPSVRLSRPLVLGGVRVLSIVRRFGWEEIGAERLRFTRTPFVLAANHVSHADTAAILGTLPRRLRGKTAVAAALDVFGPSTTGRTRRNDLLQLVVAAGFHAFAFDRHGPPLRSIRASVQLIRNGWNLLLYPEGTRSRTGQMGPFKAGVGVLARFTGCPVIPIHVEGGRQLLPQGAFMPRSARIIVRYGAPLWYQESESPDQFTERLREQVARLGRVSIETSAVSAAAAADQPA